MRKIEDCKSFHFQVCFSFNSFSYKTFIKKPIVFGFIWLISNHDKCSVTSFWTNTNQSDGTEIVFWLKYELMLQWTCYETNIYIVCSIIFFKITTERIRFAFFQFHDLYFLFHDLKKFIIVWWIATIAYLPNGCSLAISSNTRSGG